MSSFANCCWCSCVFWGNSYKWFVFPRDLVMVTLPWLSSLSPLNKTPFSLTLNLLLHLSLSPLSPPVLYLCPCICLVIFLSYCLPLPLYQLPLSLYFILSYSYIFLVSFWLHSPLRFFSLSLYTLLISCSSSLPILSEFSFPLLLRHYTPFLPVNLFSIHLFISYLQHQSISFATHYTLVLSFPNLFHFHFVLDLYLTLSNPHSFFLSHIILHFFFPPSIHSFSYFSVSSSTPWIFPPIPIFSFTVSVVSFPS